MKLLMILFLAVVSSGCAVFTPPMPQPQCPNYPESALVLDVPPPIPDNVYIRIEPGQNAKANDGGKALLRGYVDLRERIQKWQEQR